MSPQDNSRPQYIQPQEDGILRGGTSVEQTAIIDPPAFESYSPKGPKTLLHYNKWALIATGATALLVVVAGLITLGMAGFKANNQGAVSQQQPAAEYNAKNLSLANVPEDQLVAVSQATKLSINGQLAVGNTIVLTPTATPSQPKAGQMYYDKATNEAYIYNGTSFVSISGQQAATTIAGATGEVALGTGLQLTGNTLALSAQTQSAINAKVTTIQGQSGNVSLVGGAGISVVGTTISSNGITTVSGLTGIAVSKNGGTVTLSLPQLLGAGDTPSFAAVQLSNALPIASGGTNTNGASFSANGVLYYNGTSFATSPTAASDGLCLLSNASGPYFGLCSGAAAGVGSLNGASGAVILDNATANVGTGHVTLDNATSVAKGIASFTSPDFSVASGAVSLGSSVTKQGNTFNASASLIKLDTNGQASGTGQCLLSTATGTAFTSCPVGGNISSGAAQTAGRLTKFDATTNSITNSIASESGSTITVVGTVVATALQGNGSALTSLNAGNITSGTVGVGYGGTGQASFTANSLLLGNGASGLASLAAGTNGQCLVITAGIPAYGTCTGAGGVTSVNGQSSVLTIANASAASGTITIDTATTGGQKGLASFNATNFSIASGVVNTVQNINTAATPTFSSLSLQSAGGSLSGVDVGGTGVTTLQFASQTPGATRTIVIPNTAGTIAVSATGPLSLSASGVLSCATCLESGGGGAGGVASLEGLVGALDIVGANGLTVGAVGTTITLTAPSGGSAVTSLNGLNGVLTVANASAGSGTITIDNASSSAKGIASFTNPDFSVASGAVSLGSTVTKQGNTFNGANQLVALDSSGFLPALNASQLLSLDADNISSGTLSVAQGGTGAASFTTNGVVFSNGTGLGSTSAGASGQCLISNGSGSAPSFQTCSGASGVSSLNALTGNVTISQGSGINLSALGNDITIANGGVTQLQGTVNQVTVSGSTGSVTVSLPQNINTGAAVQFGSATLTGASALTLGQGSANTGAIVFKNSVNNFGTTLQSANPSGDITFTLPSSAGSADQCLITNGSGVLSFGACLSGGSGGSNGVASLNGLSGTVSIAGATGSAGTITLGDATSGVKGIASFGADFSVTTGAVSLATVSVGKGGTGLTTYTTGDLLYASGTSTIGTLNAVAIGSCLTSNGTGAAPVWGSCGAAASLQTAYTNSTGGATPEIVLDATRTTLDIKGYAGQSADLINIRDSGNTLLFGVANSGLMTANAGAYLIGTVDINTSGSSATRIGSGSSGIITIGNSAATTNFNGVVNINGGTSVRATNIGAGTGVNTTTIGNTGTGATTVNLLGGTTGAVNINTSGSAATNIGSATSAISLNGDVSVAASRSLVLGSAASDPTGVNGAMYYQTGTEKFRCYVNGAWADCSGSGAAIASGAGLTANKIVKFNGSSQLADSGLSDTGTALTYTGGNLVVNTGSGFTGNVIDLQVNAASKFSVDQAGNSLTTGGLYTGSSIIAGNLRINSSGTASNLTLPTASTVKIGSAAAFGVPYVDSSNVLQFANVNGSYASSNKCLMSDGSTGVGFGTCPGSGGGLWSSGATYSYHTNTTYKVLIGTNSIISGAASDKLQVNGGIFARAVSSTDPVMTVNNNNTYNLLRVDSGTTTGSVTIGDVANTAASNLSIYGQLSFTKPATGITFQDGTTQTTAGGSNSWTAGATYSYLTNTTYKVLIGTNSIISGAASDKLQVNGGIFARAVSSTDSSLTVTNSNSYSVLAVTNTSSTVATVTLGDVANSLVTSLSVNGTVAAQTSYSINGTSGVSRSCTGGQALNGITVVGGIVTAGTCATNGADIAESYKSVDALLPGELVAIDGANFPGVKRASTANSADLMGIVSTQPKEVLGDANSSDDYPIALNGRVPTKVNDEGGEIHAGDKITISSVAGVGKKATGAGMVVGTALSDFTGTGEGTVQVFVHLSYYEPTVTDTLQAQTATLGDLNVSGTATINNLTVTGLATVHDISISGHIITSSGQPTNEAQTAAGTGATVNIDGNDTLGTITITTGSAPAAGEMAKLIFSELYTAAPKVVLSPSNDKAARMDYFKGTTTTDGFMLNFMDAPVANTTYSFDYFIGQ